MASSKTCEGQKLLEAVPWSGGLVCLFSSFVPDFSKLKEKRKKKKYVNSKDSRGFFKSIDPIKIRPHIRRNALLYIDVVYTRRSTVQYVHADLLYAVLIHLITRRCRGNGYKTLK